MLARGLLTRLASFLGGVGLALLAWVVLLPWDLSEVDTRGRSLPRGGDDYVTRIAVVPVIVVIAGLAFIVLPRARAGGERLRGAGPWLTAGGAAAWVTLFAWRTAVARTSGANMFMIPLVFVVVPVALASVWIVNRVGKRLGTDPEAHPAAIRPPPFRRR